MPYLIWTFSFVSVAGRVNGCGQKANRDVMLSREERAE